MKNYIQHSVKVMIAVAFIALGSACKKSDSPEPPKPENGKVAIENPALVTALKEQGFTFEGNTLVVNDKVRTTTSLNLSGKQLTDVKGLEAFPALSEVNLSNNKFAQTFDFGTLPATVKSINLSGNELYDFKNLATTDYSDNAQEPYKLIRSFDKLVLPATAKYNMDVLPAYVKLAPKSDVQMLNAQGTAEKYTTLREVPDAMLLRYVKEYYPSVMEGDKIDISKNLKTEDATNAIYIDQSEQIDPDVIDTSKILNIEGIEYIFNNPRFASTIFLDMTEAKKHTFPYVKIGAKVDAFVINWLDTPIIDFSKAEKLSMIGVKNNPSIKTVDLSSSKTFMQQGTKGYAMGVATGLQLANCSSLIELKFPDLKNAPSPISGAAFILLNLPVLKSDIDFSKLQVGQEMQLGGLNAKVVFPTTKFLYYVRQGKQNTQGVFNFYITEEIFNRAETKAFIKLLIPDGRLVDFSYPATFDDAPNLTKYRYLSQFNNGSRNYVNKHNYQEVEGVFDYLKEILKNKQKKLHNK